MTERKLCINQFQALPEVFFLGSDLEIENAETEEQKAMETLEAVIMAPGFIAMQLNKESGAVEILHRSTRDGVQFQLSYIAADVVPVMHENYVQTGETSEHAYIGSLEDLKKHYVDYLYFGALELRVVFDH